MLEHLSQHEDQSLDLQSDHGGSPVIPAVPGKQIPLARGLARLAKTVYSALARAPASINTVGSK